MSVKHVLVDIELFHLQYHTILHAAILSCLVKESVTRSLSGYSHCPKVVREHGNNMCTIFVRCKITDR